MFKKGNIILIPFPFTDLSAIKVRPALIVSSNKINGDDVTVVFISSKKMQTLHPTDILLKNTEKDFATTGLKESSTFKVNKIATLDKKIILGELGEIDQCFQKKIEQKIKFLFDL